MTWSSWQREALIFSPSERRWQLHRCPQHKRVYLHLFGHVCRRLRSRVWALYSAELADKGSRVCFTRTDVSHMLWFWMHKYMNEYRSKRKAYSAQSCVIIKTANHLLVDSEISASYYNIQQWWMDLKACSFTCLLYFFLLSLLCSLSSSSSSSLECVNMGDYHGASGYVSSVLK